MTLALVIVMFISPAAGVAGCLVAFGFFLLALASFPARAAWQEGTVWRSGQSDTTQTTGQALTAGVAVALLICAGASMVWAFGADVAGAAITFTICVAGLAVLARQFRDAEWLEQTRRAYGHIGWVPKLVVATAWLIALAPEAVSAYDHEAIRDGRIWEPAILTLVAILPLGWLLWESGLLRATGRRMTLRPWSPAARADEPPTEPTGIRSRSARRRRHVLGARRVCFGHER